MSSTAKVQSGAESAAFAAECHQILAKAHIGFFKVNLMAKGPFVWGNVNPRAVDSAREAAMAKSFSEEGVQLHEASRAMKAIGNRGWITVKEKEWVKEFKEGGLVDGYPELTLKKGIEDMEFSVLEGGGRRAGVRKLCEERDKEISAENKVKVAFERESRKAKGDEKDNLMRRANEVSARVDVLLEAKQRDSWWVLRLIDNGK
jgi:hypothetical protein